MNDFVEQTWAALGQRVRPLRKTVFIRTEPIETSTKSGLLFVTEQRFYDGPMHLRLVKATVLASGSQSILEPGQRVCFQRQYLCRWKVMDDGTFVGWLDEKDVAGILDPDVDVSKYLEPVGTGRRPIQI